MKNRPFARFCALALTICLLAAALPAGADTYLPEGTVTHADFTLNFALHADAYPAGAAHWSDWETFVSKLGLRGSANVLAPFDQYCRAYLSGAVQLNGKDQLPFVYDGYHSYRYLLSPALNNVTLFFQMHNYLEFMLKPYYYMNLPTQYIALLTYPDAAVGIAQNYYAPVVEMLQAAREDALTGSTATDDSTDGSQPDVAMDDSGDSTQADVAADDNSDSSQPDVAADDNSDGSQSDVAADDSADNSKSDVATDDSADNSQSDVATDDSTDGSQPDVATDDNNDGSQPDVAADDNSNNSPATAEPANAPDAGVAIIGGADGPTSIFVSGSSFTYTVPYENLYELCENLDQLVNDPDDTRAYFFFTSLLTDILASDMTLQILGNLENELDYLDPDQNGLTVTETADGVTMTLGSTKVFTKTTAGGVTAFTLTLPTAEGYTLALDYRWTPGDAGAALSAVLTVTQDGDTAVALSAQGVGLPQEGDLSGSGCFAFTASGSAFQTPPEPADFTFRWSRNSAARPYALDLNVDWLHPQTQKPALSLHFNGTLSTVDKSVFVDGQYPQNDFFSLNETFLDDYKAQLMPTLTLKLAPFVLEMPSGVIDDLYRFTSSTDILVSLVE